MYVIADNSTVSSADNHTPHPAYLSMKNKLKQRFTPPTYYIDPAQILGQERQPADVVSPGFKRGRRRPIRRVDPSLPGRR